ncbi:MAG: hypothetical protein II956_14575 [Bacteroidales bacterium]|nr:hypothetical protein [Bacteroidales bacterium]
MATATLNKTRRFSAKEICNKYLKNLTVGERKEIIFFLVNSFSEEKNDAVSEEEETKSDKKKETDEEFIERFRKKHGLELSPDLQWVHDHPVVFTEEDLKDERTRYILSKCGK